MIVEDIIQQELRNVKQLQHRQITIMTQKMITMMVHALHQIAAEMKLDLRFFPYLHSELTDEIIKVFCSFFFLPY